MAIFDFGQVILNAIRAEDELNQRREQFQQQQRQFLANYGLALQRADTEQQRLNYEENKPLTNISQYGATTFDKNTGKVNYFPTGLLNPTVSKNIESQYMKTSEIPQGQLKNFPQSSWMKGSDINRMNEGQYVSPDENYISRSAYNTKLGDEKLKMQAENIKSQIADRNSAMAKRNYDINSSKSDKEAKKIADYQNTYNSIMGAQFMPMGDLINKGYIKEDDAGTDIYGGGYVVEGKGKPKVFFKDKDLENYAKQVANKAPNQWTRTTDIKTPPQNEIDYLKAHPEAKNVFDQQYGQGASDKYLGK